MIDFKELEQQMAKQERMILITLSFCTIIFMIMILILLLR